MLASASQEAHANRFVGAEQLLAEFAARHPASPEAVESLYWRGIFRLDPSNPAASAREAGALFESYLGRTTGAHRTEASMLRRLASSMEARAAAIASTPAPAPTPTPSSADRAKDEEMQRLREELAKANAELERIRRRLAQPRP